MLVSVLSALALPMGYVLFLAIFVLVSELCEKEKERERAKRLAEWKKKEELSFKKQWDAFYESRRKQK